MNFNISIVNSIPFEEDITFNATPTIAFLFIDYMFYKIPPFLYYSCSMNNSFAGYMIFWGKQMSEAIVNSHHFFLIFIYSREKMEGNGINILTSCVVE